MTYALLLFKPISKNENKAQTFIDLLLFATLWAFAYSSTCAKLCNSVKSFSTDTDAIFDYDGGRHWLSFREREASQH